MKSRVQIARDVIAGYYGSGDARIAKLKQEGYNPGVVQGDVNTLLCCRENIINNIRAQAVSIAANNNWWYIYWTEPYGHECAICHPHGGANHGWQCIGAGIAAWHHGGLPIKCNCGVIDNGTGEKIYAASTDAKALSLAQNAMGFKDIEVIRNNGKAIPKSKAQPGDIALMILEGGVFQHLYVIMSDSKVFDSSHGATKADDIRADRNFSGRYVSYMKVLIRYTGDGLTTPPKRTIDQLAHEVIDGLWGSGTSRQTALKQAGHDYNAVQKRVNEILNPSPAPAPTPTPTPTPSEGEAYPGAYPVVKKYLEPGDKGTEVTKLQNYLNWYTDGQFFKECGGADGIYGKNTLRYVNKMLTDFFGAKEADGLVGNKTIAKMKAYRKPKKPTPGGGYTGKFPTYRLVKDNAKVKADACKWAIWIAGWNIFHYGHGQHAHHNGCYFCGTQRLKQNHGIVDPDFTYCCNPFVGAAYAHGGGDAEAYKKCNNCSSLDFGTGSGSYEKSKNYDNLGHPAKSKLQAGDVLCNDHHVALYVGNGKVAEASGGDDNVRNSKAWNNSIHVVDLTDSKYKSFPRVYRYNGSVDCDRIITYGEVSDRIYDLQNYLNWYFDGAFFKECGEADGYYGKNTLKYVKMMQTDFFGTKEADGSIGQKTIEKMKAVTK